MYLSCPSRDGLTNARKLSDIIIFDGSLPTPVPDRKRLVWRINFAKVEFIRARLPASDCYCNDLNSGFEEGDKYYHGECYKLLVQFNLLCSNLDIWREKYQFPHYPQTCRQFC